MTRTQPDGNGKLFFAAFAILAITAVATPAFAMKTDRAPTGEQSLLEQAIRGKCVPAAAEDALRAYELKIAAAATVEDARELILLQTGRAKKALSTASSILPFSPAIREAREKIETLEARVYAANTQAEVATEFSDLLAGSADTGGPAIVDRQETDGSPMILAGTDLNQPAVSVSSGDGHGCDYTTGEIIIIVLGFLLFIIPGIIFLVIFC